MLEVSLIVVMALHLMCVNVASAGPLVCIFLEWKEARRSELAGRLGRFLAWKSIALLVVGSLLGLLLGYLLWDESYRAVLEKFSQRISYGVWEILFSLVLMVLHASWWSWSAGSRWWSRLVRTLLLLLAGTNLLYHFPFLFVMISDVDEGLTRLAGPVDGAAFRQLSLQGAVLARVTHIWLASFAMTGVAMMCWALCKTRSSDVQNGSSQAAVWGARLALVATLWQIPVGLWVLSQLPRTAQRRLLGGEPVGTVLFLGSVLLTLWLLHQLAAVSMGETRRGLLAKVIFTMALIIVLMTGVLQQIAV